MKNGTNTGVNSNYFVETFSTTLSSSKGNKLSRAAQGAVCKQGETVGQNRSQGELSGSKLQKQPVLYYPLRSNEVIRNIHTVKREKRLPRDKFYKIKSCDDIHGSPAKDTGRETNNKVIYNWNQSVPFQSNPIEMLRQERLRRERMRMERIQREKDKLKGKPSTTLLISTLH